MGDRGKRNRLLLWGLLAAILVGGAYTVWAIRFRTYHMNVVQEGVLYRSGHRSLSELATTCRRANIRTIVMLNDADEVQREPFAGERAFCDARGIRLEWIPVTVGSAPTTDDVRRFLEIMAKRDNHPVLVHCAQGVKRTGMMIAAFQKSLLGMDDDQAEHAMLLLGRSRPSLETIHQFIHDFDAPTRTVRTLQPASPTNSVSTPSPDPVFLGYVPLGHTWQTDEHAPLIQE